MGSLSNPGKLGFEDFLRSSCVDPQARSANSRNSDVPSRPLLIASSLTIPAPDPAASTLKRTGSRRGLRNVALMTLAVLVSAGPLDAQPRPNQPTVRINFPQEIEIKLLADYVSERLGVKFLYDNAIANQKLSIRAPGEVPLESLLGILESALRMKGLALVDMDAPGWKQIVKGPPRSRVVDPRGINDPRQMRMGVAVTQVFPLEHVAPSQVSQALRPFLTPQDANAVPLETQRLLVVTDYADNLTRIARLIELIDREGPELVFEFYRVQHAESSVLAEQVQQLLGIRKDNGGHGADLGITHDDRTNYIAVLGTRPRVDEVIRLLRSMDVPSEMTTEIYALAHVSADRIDSLVREIIDPGVAKRLYRSAIDEADNLLIVTAPAHIHQRIQALRARMDVRGRSSRTPIRFYRLKHANAADVLQTIQAIESSGLPNPASQVRGASAYGRGTRTDEPPGVQRFDARPTVPGPNRPPQLGSQLTPPPAFRGPGPNAANLAFGPSGLGPLPGLESESPPFLVPGTQGVAADLNTNSLIVVGPPAVQKAYEELIRSLDRRRPQVLIEAKVVQVDATDDFSLGMELSSQNLFNGQKTLFALTSFGLSAVDPVTGTLAITPGRGLNSTLVDADSANHVLKALTTHRRSRVLSAPRILVNDNATGTLASVAEVPFTSINASQTVATTSFAGFAEAGTTIKATPRIADGDTIELEYTVSLNSFTGTGSDGSPPPRQTDEVKSSVTIPDGHTLIVGGLTRETHSDSQEGIPFLENVPIVRKLTGVVNRASTRATLFIFLRPMILKDDKFRELRFVSERDLYNASLPGPFPCSEPVSVRELHPAPQ